MSEKIIAALDMGGTNIKGCLFRDDLTPAGAPIQTPVDSQGDSEHILSALAGTLVRLCADCGPARVARLCVSTPGPFEYEPGRAKMTEKYGAIYAVPLREEFRRRVPLTDDVPICFLSDANAFLLGEALCGAGRGCRDLAAVTLGTGLGYSVMKNGRVLTNENGRPYDVPAVDSCNGGTLQTFCSGRGLAARCLAETGSVRTARQMAESADPVSLKLFREMGFLLGSHLQPRLASLGIRRLIMGGQVSYALPLFLDALSSSLPGVAVIRAERPADAALCGAVAYGLGRTEPWQIVGV